MTETWFDHEWEVEIIGHDRVDHILKLENVDIGSFFASQAALDLKPNIQNHKILSLIYESSVFKIQYILCNNAQKSLLIDSQSKYRVVSWDDLLSHFPRNITEKQERIVSLLAGRNGDVGEEIALTNFFHYQYFSKNDSEMFYLLGLMKNKGLIHINISHTLGGRPVISPPFRIEENGWLLIERNMANQLSKKVFVAMWFDESMTSAFAVMEIALNELGFDVIRIDLKEHNNEISGEILYEIRQCKFLVADVTGQRQGVYFEAGFALGQGLPVIWTCRADHLSDVHFDTRQYNHIIWKTEADLGEKLRNRVKGTIL
jgi:nucleoside 2-deoxyribosyltransferase